MAVTGASASGGNRGNICPQTGDGWSWKKGVAVAVAVIVAVGGPGDVPAGDECVVHYYDITPDDDPFGTGEAAIRAAAEPEYEVSIETRRIVRSYAPGQVNVCIDARLSR
jgi:hypothetical protein